MKNRFLLIISLNIIASIIGCSSPNEKANGLYVEAIQIMQSANINKTKSYSDTYELYKKIGSNYSADDLADKIPDLLHRFSK